MSTPVRANGDDAIYLHRPSHFVPYLLRRAPAAQDLTPVLPRALPEYFFFPLFPITVPCRGSVTGKSLPDYFAVRLTPRHYSYRSDLHWDIRPSPAPGQW